MAMCSADGRYPAWSSSAPALRFPWSTPTTSPAWGPAAPRNLGMWWAILVQRETAVWVWHGSIPRPSGGPAPGVFGNAGLNILRGPSFRSSDLALFKNIKFAERLSAQVRLEAFNFLNHPVLGDPALDPRSGSFGIISSKSSERNLQLGLKLMF